jgi:Fic family protein
MQAGAMEPLMPRDGELDALAVQVVQASSRLAGMAHPRTARAIAVMLRNVNSYYSNLIEGHRTTLSEIEAGLREDPSPNEKLQKLRALHRAHVRAQSAAEQRMDALELADVAAPESLRDIHRDVFTGVDEEFLVQKNADGSVSARVAPGEFRSNAVTVGRFTPPPWEEIPTLLRRFHAGYALRGMPLPRRVIAAAASHHRLLWIHPFLEGNGRVARIFTEMYLRQAGLDGPGLWSMSRGLARGQGRYKQLLALADAPRAGDYDGRGALSDKALGDFCRYFLGVALDQVEFMGRALGLDAARKNIGFYCRLRNEGALEGRRPLPPESARVLLHAFTYGIVEKGDVAQIIGASDRKARDVAKALQAEGLLATSGNKAPYTLGLPMHFVEHLFPALCGKDAFAQTRTDADQDLRP